MKQPLKQGYLSVKDAAAVLSLPYKRLYAMIDAKRKKQDVVFAYNGKRFFIAVTSCRVSLLPLDSANINIEEIEDNAVKDFIEMSKEHLCEDCLDKIIDFNGKI